MIAILPFLLFAAQGDGAAAAAAPTGREQIFIAPSGEPFRVSGDAPYPVAQWFSGADKNGDGKLDLAEFTADFLRFFDELDVDHDGWIDSAERFRYENQIAPETLGNTSDHVNAFANDADDSDIAGEGAAAEGAVSPAKPLYGSNPTGAARFDLLGLPEPVAAMDTELRGRISRRVAEQAAHDRFALLDQQHRGYLTLDGLPPTFAKRGGSGERQRRGGGRRGGHTGHGGYGGGGGFGGHGNGGFGG